MNSARQEITFAKLSLERTAVSMVGLLLLDVFATYAAAPIVSLQPADAHGDSGRGAEFVWIARFLADPRPEPELLNAVDGLESIPVAPAAVGGVGPGLRKGPPAVARVDLEL